MKLDAGQLGRLADELGFQSEALEKVVQLVDLLDALRSHPFLADRLVLKGGTAINIFVLDMPRLSVDIDLNYTGSAELEAMQTERPALELAIQAVCERQGLRVRRAPEGHAGGKWRLSYHGTEGRTGSLELDLNFLLRVPIYEPTRMDSPSFLGVSANQVPTLDLHELLAGKLAALFSRTASRDLFDSVRVLQNPMIDLEKLRLAFVVYGSGNRRDWRNISLDDIRLSPREADQMLVPLLRRSLVPSRREVTAWCETLASRCRDLVAGILPFRSSEREFLDLVNDHGEVRAERLTDDREIRRRIEAQPALQWKASHVRRHKGR